jgi:hypothetical protein
MKAKKSLLLLLLVGLVLLDFAALDDITTGNEPNLTSEYLILTLTIPILSYYFTQLITLSAFKIQRNIIKLTPLKEYHIHHSMVGLIIMLCANLTDIVWHQVLLVGFGLGMFIHHTVTEGLIFITKNKDDRFHKRKTMRLD